MNVQASKVFQNKPLLIALVIAGATIAALSTFASGPALLPSDPKKGIVAATVWEDKDSKKPAHDKRISKVVTIHFKAGQCNQNPRIGKVHKLGFDSSATAGTNYRLAVKADKNGRVAFECKPGTYKLVVTPGVGYSIHPSSRLIKHASSNAGKVSNTPFTIKRHKAGQPVPIISEGGGQD